MKVFVDDRQRAHDPAHCIQMGQLAPNREQPARVDRLLAGARAAGAVPSAPGDFGLAPIARVHAPDYLHFLRSIHARWSALPGAAPQVIPNTHPRSRDDGRSDHPVGQAGRYQGDTACPIGAETWDAAYWSAQSALSATREVLEGAPLAYALCRPPGHHAYADMAAGFCFLNNSAIAADTLARHGRRPAVLDIDVHHGNGTQAIFYDRGDVLTCSVHCDPDALYPFFWGHAHEHGEGAGTGCNLNLPLPRGAGDAAFLGALDQALERVQDWAADCLVVALGLDAHEGDPFQALRVTTDGFHRIGERIAQAGLPVVAVQEGGYLSDDLGTNLEAALCGLASKEKAT